MPECIEQSRGKKCVVLERICGADVPFAAFAKVEQAEAAISGGNCADLANA